MEESNHINETNIVTINMYNDYNSDDDEIDMCYNSDDENRMNHVNETDVEIKMYYDSDDDEMNTKKLFFAKLDMLEQLGSLADCGVDLPKCHNLDSDYNKMKYDYEIAKFQYDNINRIESVKKILMTASYAIKMTDDLFNSAETKLQDTIDVEQIDTNIDNMEINIEI